MNKLEYFKTAVWTESKIEFLKSLNKASDPYIKDAIKKDKNTFGISHHSTTLLNDTKFKDFHDYVGQKCWEYLDTQGFDMSQYELFFQESWVQQFSKKGGGHHSAKVNWNTHVNALYFLKCSSDSSYPIFHDPRVGSRATKLRMKQDNILYNEVELINFKPKPGDLIIFPGYLEHEFSLDKSKKDFRYIHTCMTGILKTMAKEG